MDNSLGKASYLLLIEPEKKVSFRIEKLRDAIHSEFSMVANPFFNPHVTVLDFVQYESYENRIVAGVKEIIGQLNPFNLRFSDFGTFLHTFYLQVKPVPRELSRIIQKKNELKGLIRTPINTQSVYHLTIFKDLNEEMGENIWSKCKDRTFEDEFQVSEMILLRRKDHQRHYQEVSRIPLLGREARPTYIQGKLFD